MNFYNEMVWNGNEIVFTDEPNVGVASIGNNVPDEVAEEIVSRWNLASKENLDHINLVVEELLHYQHEHRKNGVCLAALDAAKRLLELLKDKNSRAKICYDKIRGIEDHIASVVAKEKKEEERNQDIETVANWVKTTLDCTSQVIDTCNENKDATNVLEAAKRLGSN